MRAPRLNIGIFADGENPIDLRNELTSAGHTVAPVSDPTEIQDHELIVISVADNRLEETVVRLATYARRGQMFLHTSLTHGIQIMDALETEGTIVMAACPIGEERWVVGSVDELGETIIGLLVGELGGSIIEVDDVQRQQLAAAVTYMSFVRTLSQDAVRFLDSFIGDIEVSHEIVQGASSRFIPIPKLDSLMSQYESVEDPGRKRLFRDLARRQAEISRAQDIELWAIQKEDR